VKKTKTASKSRTTSKVIKMDLPEVVGRSRDRGGTRFSTEGLWEPDDVKKTQDTQREGGSNHKETVASGAGTRKKGGKSFERASGTHRVISKGVRTKEIPGPEGRRKRSEGGNFRPS